MNTTNATMSDALRYVKQVKGVIRRLAALFHGKKDLLLGFNFYLPEGYRIEFPLNVSPFPVYRVPGRPGVTEIGIYEGEWKNGLKHGKGIEKRAGGIYEGEWKDDKEHGKGTYKYSGGRVYEGG